MRHFLAFVKSEMKDQWGNKVKVRHVRGVLPTIVLKSADGRVQKSLNVSKKFYDFNGTKQINSNVID